MTTTIMMVTFNRLGLTKRTLEGLFKTTKGFYNFIVVDNGSDDGTQNFFNKLKSPPNVNLVTHYFSENRGIARGRNKALYIADNLNTEWYVTFDNDVEMPDGWNVECQNILEKNKNYGQIGVNMEDKVYQTVTKNGCTFQHKPQGNLGTACAMFNKKLHKMIGFFSQEYEKLYGEEDADFGMRARVAGFQLGYIKENGNHFGVGELDQGEYREFKTACHNKNLKKFQQNCALYYSRKKPIYIPYKDEDIS